MLKGKILTIQGGLALDGCIVEVKGMSEDESEAYVTILQAPDHVGIRAGEDMTVPISALRDTANKSGSLSHGLSTPATAHAPQGVTTNIPINTNVNQPQQTINGGVNVMMDIKTTMNGETAVRGSGDAYYTVKNGVMKREYLIMENVAAPIQRLKQTLELDDILIYNGEVCFCSGVQDTMYTITSFATRSVQQVQRADELDAIENSYTVIINPISVMLEADKDANPTSLLAINPSNSNALSLGLQIEQNSMFQDYMADSKDKSGKLEDAMALLVRAITPQGTPQHEEETTKK